MSYQLQSREKITVSCDMCGQPVEVETLIHGVITDRGTLPHATCPQCFTEALDATGFLAIQQLEQEGK